MAGVVLQACVVDDGPAIGPIIAAAFWPDPMYYMKFHRSSLEHVSKQQSLRTGKMLLADPTRRRHQKAVDPITGEILGYARWLVTDVPEADHYWAEARLSPVSETQRARAVADFEASDWPADETLDPSPDPIDEAIERIGYEHRWLLEIVAVTPEARGRGIGTLLVESGLRQAAAQGQDVTILAKRLAMDFYPRFGFELVEEVRRDDTAYGPGNYGAYFMVKRFDFNKS